MALTGAFFKVLAILIAFSLMASPASAAEKKLLVFGDSLVAGYGLPENQSFPAQLQQKLTAKGVDVEVVNAGVSGDTTTGALTRLAWTIQQQHPTHALVVIGGNDMLRHVDMKITRANLEKIADQFDQAGIPLLLAGMKSFRNLSPFGNAFQDMYEDIADDHNAELYPFFLEGVAMQGTLNQEDSIHPNAAGVALIVDNILPDVEKLLEQVKTKKDPK